MIARHLLRAGLILCLPAILLAPRARAQEYHNTVNVKFNTVSNGPQSGIVVDVHKGDSREAVQRAIAERVRAVQQTRESNLQKREALLRRYYKRGGAGLGVPDIVFLREDGKLLPPPARTRADGDITFTIGTTADDGWTQVQANVLQRIVDIVKPEMDEVYGKPAWTGTVRILNRETSLGGRQKFSSGAFVFNGGTPPTGEIWTSAAKLESNQDIVFSLTQLMALAYRGPKASDYDIWEKGMARAATVAVIRNRFAQLDAALGPNSGIDPFYDLYVTPYYDLWNQPPLGASRFFPPQKVAAPFENFDMLPPRLTMSSTAWLKVYIERLFQSRDSFFKEFNAAYYAAFDADPTVKGNVPILKQIAASKTPQVEGRTFDDWFQRQWIMDSSDSVGPKLYAWTLPIPPSPPSDGNSAAVTLIYYNTESDGDETPRNGVCYPIYWDFDFTNRLFFDTQYERVDIRDGLGTVSPVFVNTGPNFDGRMRITMDFPVNSELARVRFPARATGTAAAPFDFYGVLKGGDSGVIDASVVNVFSGEAATGHATVEQGVFPVGEGEGKLSGDITTFHRGTYTFTPPPTSGLPTVTRIVNIPFVAPLLEIEAQDPVEEIPYSFDPVLQMVAFHVRPLAQDLADALGRPQDRAAGSLLMAKWYQNLPGDDKYRYYPNLTPIEPGQGYWLGFLPSQADNNGKVTGVIRGRSTKSEPTVSVALRFGWNQVGNPYRANIALADIEVQYLSDNTAIDSLPASINRGRIAQGVFAYNPGLGYTPVDTMEPFKAYFVRVLVTEGVTLTFRNPNRIDRSAKVGGGRSVLSVPTGWRLNLNLRDKNGRSATAAIGMAPDANAGFDAAHDAMKPPAVLTRGTGLELAFPHPDWNDNAGDFLADVRRDGSGTTWDMTAAIPTPNESYTLTWSDLAAKLPRGQRLTLVDKKTGTRQFMNGSSGYTFRAGEETTRSFQIVAEPRSGRRGLQIANVTARNTRAAGSPSFAIAYELSASAETQAEILSATGKPIRRLVSGRAAAVGTNQVVWDARDDQARTVPSGVYLVKITARTPEGEQTTATRPVVVVR